MLRRTTFVSVNLSRASGVAAARLCRFSLTSSSTISVVSSPFHHQTNQQIASLLLLLQTSCRMASTTTATTTINSNKRVELDDGRVYDGPFDEATGAPTTGCKLTDGPDYYIGEFNEKWQRHGRGKAVLDGGQTTEEGIFAEDEFVQGTLVTQDESGDRVVFTGHLKDNQFHRGTLEHREYSYSGGFENNEPHGTSGTLKFATGAIQEGTFFRGKLHGDRCKWRLESGQVYLGNFVHGVITSGELRTPEFTYEGEFNERGQAHGVGRQEHHATTPKLIFRGHWAHGSLVTGQCQTEDGQPIDWQNDPAAQDQLSSKSQQVLSSYMRSKFDDARSAHGEATKRFADDADVFYEKTGKRPDAIDLGYEAGPIRTAKIQEQQGVKSVEQRERAKSRALWEADELSKQEAALKQAYDEKQKRIAADAGVAAAQLRMESEKYDHVTGGSMKVMTASGSAAVANDNDNNSRSNSNSNNDASMRDVDAATAAAAEDISNWQQARANLVKQRGKQMSTADTIEDQFERFKLKKKLSDAENSNSSCSSTLSTPSSSSSGLGNNRLSGDEDDVVVDPAPEEVMSKTPVRLRVDGNEPFVDVAVKTHQRRN